MMNTGFDFDELSKALATSVTRRAAFVRVAQLLGGLVFGTLGLRSSVLHGAPPKHTMKETLQDKTFNCVASFLTCLAGIRMQLR